MDVELANSSDMCRKNARDALIRLIIASNTIENCPHSFDTFSQRRQFFTSNPCFLKLSCGRFDKYGRVLAHIQGPDEGSASFAQELIRCGWVKRYVKRHP